jgi:hypothetical protein
MDGFWRDAWASFKATYGPVLTVLAFALGLGGFFYAPGATATIGWNWLIAAAALLMVLVFTAWDMLASARRSAWVRLPRIVDAVDSDEQLDHRAVPLLLLLESSSLFGPGVLVSVFRNEHRSEKRVLERLIGLGYVLNVQADGLIQVEILAETPYQAEIWRRIKAREVSALREIVVKPSFPREGLALLGAVER